ncbi:class I SAM-dependent methyltransferase [Belliella marina]|uniref:Class I SAM-dependent methyltransferase n=1 Tax=Belliella marina TaxID=1644146 RepID=A0ABW4VSX6_9BACT
MDTKKHNKIIVEQFSKQAGSYTSITSHSDALDKLIHMSSANQNDTVLDVACGSGIVSCGFARHTSHVIGIDITKEMINEGKKLQEKSNLENITWQIGDVASLPYGDNLFSIVISRFGFHHFLNPIKVLSEMKRVCKPNGLVMVVDVSLPDAKIDKYNEMEKNRDNSHVAALSLTEFQNLFTDVGLTQVEKDKYVMEISLDEQLQASFPVDKEGLRNMILSDVGVDELGVNATKISGEVFLNYPIHIFCARKA